jgi:DNA-binding transcriptional LysR family regulator
MRTIPDWNKLKTFYLTAEARSFSSAAEKMGVSQSSISRQIASLESEIGSVLFNRNTKGLTLTEQGELLYDTAKSIYKKVSEAEDLLIRGRTTPQGTLKVTTTTSFGSLWLSPIMPKFAKLYPDIYVDLILDDTPMDLARRDADFAIRMWQPQEPDLISKAFLKVQCNYYASEDYLAEHGEPKIAEDLDNHRLIAFSAPILGLRDGLNMHLLVGGRSAHKKQHRKPCFSANNLRSVYHAAQAGLGIASLPDYMAKVSRLKKILIDVPNKSFQTYIVYPHELRNTKRVAVFRDFLWESAKNWGE